MLRTNYERQAVIQRLLNQKEETEVESFINEDASQSQFMTENPSTVSKENDYDIPAEVILSQTTKEKKGKDYSQMGNTMQRYVNK